MSQTITRPYDQEIRARIDKMQRRKAEEQADNFAAIAIATSDRCNRLAADKIRLQEQNALLMETLHAVAGYPRRLMLTAWTPEVTR